MNDLVKGFTRRYGVKTLVRYKVYEVLELVVQHEKPLKSRYGHAR